MAATSHDRTQNRYNWCVTQLIDDELVVVVAADAVPELPVPIEDIQPLVIHTLQSITLDHMDGGDLRRLQCRRLQSVALRGWYVRDSDTVMDLTRILGGCPALTSITIQTPAGSPHLYWVHWPNSLPPLSLDSSPPTSVAAVMWPRLVHLNLDDGCVTEEAFIVIRRSNYQLHLSINMMHEPTEYGLLSTICSTWPGLTYLDMG